MMEQATEDEVKAVAQRQGLDLVIHRLAGGAPHVMFNRSRDGKRALDFWPSTGKWWAHDSGQRGRAAGLVEALVVAAGQLAKMEDGTR